MAMLMRAAALAILIASAAPAAARTAIPQAPVASTHQRLLPLEGGQNFRDLGGYRTSDGRAVRWGLLYRSGSMHFLTAADYAYLARLGIRTVCDFRDQRERAAEPAAWPAGSAPRLLSEDYAQERIGDLGKAPTAQEAHASLAAFYPLILRRFNGQYRRMFAELLAGRAPLVFNCTAGKDRTGVAAALLLTALGVPRETVIADYLLSNRYYDPAKTMKAASPGSPLLGLPPEVLKAYLSVDRSYIAAIFAVLDAHAGGAPGYLRDELGLSPADIRTLRRMYTR